MRKKVWRHSRIRLSVLLMALAAGSIYAVFVRDLRNARARVGGKSQTVETSFGALEYAEMGEGQPVLVIHGAAGGFDQGLEMTSALAKRGYRLVAPSRFGYLRSALPAHLTTAMQADAYEQLLDHLGIDQAAVVTISAGAWSGLQFAIRHPNRCRALVLLVPADYLPPGMAIHGGWLANAAFHSDFAAWATVKLMPMMPGAMTRAILGTDSEVVHAAGPPEKERVREIMEHLLPMSERTGGMEFDIQTAATRELYALEKISCPVLTMSAEDDRFGTATRARYISAKVRDGRAVIFTSGGHALVGDSSDVLREATQFLDTVTNRALPR